MINHHKKIISQISTASIIAALYASITVLLAPISYYPIQVRVSEALTLLPYIFPSAVWGLFIGCLIANIFGGLGVYDIFIGSVLTLIAAYLTKMLAKTKKPWLAPLPPIFLNGFGVSAYLVGLLHIFPEKNILHLNPYFTTAIFIIIGEIIATYVIGLPILMLIIRRKRG